MEGPSSEDDSSSTEDEGVCQGIQDDKKLTQRERSPVALSSARASSPKVSVAATTKPKRKAGGDSPAVDKKKTKIENTRDRLDRWEEVGESFAS